MQKYIPSKRFSLWVLLPTFFAALYFFVLATPVYRSSASIVVSNPSKESGGVSAFLTGGTGDSLAGAFLAKEFITSWSEFKAIDATIPLRKLWNDGDIISSYYKLHNSEVGMYRYYKSKVVADFDKKSGIITLETYAYSAKDAQKLNTQLISDTQNQLNAINAQKDMDLTRTAQMQFEQAKDAVAKDNAAIAAFRQRTGYYKPDLDYAAAVQAQGTLSDSLASAKADYQGVNGDTPNNPAIGGMKSKIASFNRDRAAAAAKASTINSVAKQYDVLEAQRGLHVAMLQKASALVQDAALKTSADHYYLNVLSEPSAPADAEFPRALWLTTIAFFAFLIFYKLIIRSRAGY